MTPYTPGSKCSDRQTGWLVLTFPVFRSQPAGELLKSRDSCSEAQLWEGSVAGLGSLTLYGRRS